MLDSKKINDWLQVLGLFGVLGGLVFVGLQLSLDRQIAVVQGTEAATSNRLYWSEIVGANAEAWVKGLAGQPLSDAEAATFNALAAALELRYFNDYSRAVRGISPQLPERWVLEFAGEVYGNPGLERWWAENKRREDERRERLGLEPSPDWDSYVTAELQRLTEQSRQ